MQFDGALSSGSRSGQYAPCLRSVWTAGWCLKRDAISSAARSCKRWAGPSLSIPSIVPSIHSIQLANDRIADNNLLTLGVASPAYRRRPGRPSACAFSDQVLRPAGWPPRAPSDDAAGRGITGPTSSRSLTQYNPKTGAPCAPPSAPATAQQLPTVSIGRRTASAAQDQRQQLIDVGWQPAERPVGRQRAGPGPRAWARRGRWYTVGRLNCNIRTGVDTVVGLEYDGCCWIGRVVLERLQNSTSPSNTRLLFQIEFVGFSRRAWAPPAGNLQAARVRYQYLQTRSAAQPFQQLRLNQHSHEPRVMTLALAASLACLIPGRPWRRATRPPVERQQGPGIKPQVPPAPVSTAPWRHHLLRQTPGPRSADFIVAIVNSGARHQLRSAFAHGPHRAATGTAGVATPPPLTRTGRPRGAGTHHLERCHPAATGPRMNLKVDDYAVNQAEAAVAQQTA